MFLCVCVCLCLCLCVVSVSVCLCACLLLLYLRVLLPMPLSLFIGVVRTISSHIQRSSEENMANWGSTGLQLLLISHLLWASHGFKPAFTSWCSFGTILSKVACSNFGPRLMHCLEHCCGSGLPVAEFPTDTLFRFLPPHFVFPVCLPMFWVYVFSVVHIFLNEVHRARFSQ